MGVGKGAQMSKRKSFLQGNRESRELRKAKRQHQMDWTLYQESELEIPVDLNNTERNRRRRRRRRFGDLLEIKSWLTAIPKPDMSAVQMKWSEIRAALTRVRLDSWVEKIKALDGSDWRKNKWLVWAAQGAIGIALIGGLYALTPGGDQAGLAGNSQEVNKEDTAVLSAANPPSADVVRKACQISIDGQPAFVVASREEAEKLVNEAVNFFSYGQVGEGMEVLEVKAKQQITYEDVEVTGDKILPAADVRKMLIDGKGEKVRYVVQQGDTLWGIAAKHGMNWEELRQANAQLVNENKLQLGQEIFLNRPTYYLNVVTTYKITAEEDIPFATKVERDDDMRPGAVKVKQEGVKGKKIATYVVSKENNIQFEEALAAENILQQPVQRVEVRGNRYMVASRGSAGGSYSAGGNGTLSWPTNGRRITSGFGYRGREFHPAIDIDLNTGEPIYAAADGVVVTAGWGGGYGKTIVIDHGGIQTRYAHLSQLYVGEGQTVSRGAHIGAGGSTGRSYGSHLHFEVHQGGPKNPLGYLR